MDSSRPPFPEHLFALGYHDLISVIPPNATLTPSSKIPQAAVGKVPGRRNANGMWGGFDWRRHATTRDDVQRWTLDRANIGLKADRFPGVDIDCTDAGLAQIVEDTALAMLGAAPVRTGRAPKRLLMYRTAEPFSRMRLWIHRRGDNHLVEVLGQGQQYVVHGTHPATMQPYQWAGPPRAADTLPTITRDQAAAFLAHLAELLPLLHDVVVEREGDGRPITRTAASDQAGLLAPSMETLAQAVELIPNTNDLFPDRTSYLTMGYAIRAACGDQLEDGYALFAAWADQWEGNGRAAGNDPEVVRADWRRMRGPFPVGWSWIAEQARGFGFNDAPDHFDTVEAAPRQTSEAPEEAPVYSDQWLAERVVGQRRGELRFVPAMGKWLVWDTSRWFVDTELLAEDAIKQELRVVADQAIRQGTTLAEKKKAGAVAISICSGSKAAAVGTLVKSDRRVAVGVDSLDHDGWALNTPGGIVDLRTGVVTAATPDTLCTKSTSVPADFSGHCPQWHRFLDETTRRDAELIGYLKRLAGYCLTGSTREQQLTFIHGPGGNGKSVFLNVLSGILGDYACVASMDAFTHSFGDKHPTDIAMLVGARLVTASETRGGKRWDEARLKSLTGSEPVTARFMRQNNFTYTPYFKLIFVGNHKPEIRDVDQAMRRRIHIVPFTVEPKVVDHDLGLKLRAEWPAILAWMIEGCQEWQREGLNAPEVVRTSSADYFSEQDTTGRWLEEECELTKDGFTTLRDLFTSWREWCNRLGEPTGTDRQFSQSLANRGYTRRKDSRTRRWGYCGITVRPTDLVEALT